MKILTGNALKTGEVMWWTGDGWSRHVTDAVDVGEQGESIAAVEEGARRINAPGVIEGELTADGPRPAHIKDRIRASGPTVRADLCLDAPFEIAVRKA